LAADTERAYAMLLPVAPEEVALAAEEDLIDATD
jgi:hypothetical protein